MNRFVSYAVKLLCFGKHVTVISLVNAVDVTVTSLANAVAPFWLPLCGFPDVILSLFLPLWFCLLRSCVWLLLLVPLLPTLNLYYLDYIKLKVKPNRTTLYTQEFSLSSSRDLNILLHKVSGLHILYPVHLVWLPHSQQTV